MTRVIFLATAALALSGASTAAADVVTDWTGAALDAIRAHNTSPHAATRQLAMLHLAVYDAVNGILGTHEPYLAPASEPPLFAWAEAAATAAARDVLSALFPDAEAHFDAIHATVLSGIADGSHKTDGIAWGQTVAAAMLAARAGDGSDAAAVWPTSDEPGVWRPTESFGGNVLPALLPLWGQVSPFALRSGSQFRPPAPPALHTGRYALELEQVKSIGAVDSSTRTAEQTEIAWFWAYGPATATPPGHWNEVALSVAVSQGNTLAENARMFALLNMALADAAIVSWDCKYEFNYWRPITAIPLADTDGNRRTKPHPRLEAASGDSALSGVHVRS
jgi:hypothetical protein